MFQDTEIKLFAVPEITFTGHSKSSAMSSFVRCLDYVSETSYTYVHTKLLK